MPPSSTAEIRAWAQANGHAVGDRGRLPAEVVSAYHAAAPGPKRPRPAKATPARPATTAAAGPVTAVNERPGPQPAKPAGPISDTPSDALLERISRLEQQVADLTARLDATDSARAVSLRRSRFRRRS